MRSVQESQRSSLEWTRKQAQINSYGPFKEREVHELIEPLDTDPFSHVERQVLFCIC